MRACTNQPPLQRRNSLGMLSEWKNLEGRNKALTALVSRLPAFTKIYKENLLLRQSRRKDEDYSEIRSSCKSQHEIGSLALQEQEKPPSATPFQREAADVISNYELMIA
jgi:hypothetical protein